MSTSLGTPPRSGLFPMPFPLLHSPIHARWASPHPCGTRSLTAPLVRSIRFPYHSNRALSTYAVSTSRRSPPPPTLFLPVPPRGLLPLLSAPLPAFVPCWTSDLPHMPLLGATVTTPPYTPLTSFEAALCLVPFISPFGTPPPPIPPDLGPAVGAQRLPSVWVIRPSVNRLSLSLPRDLGRPPTRLFFGPPS